MDDLKKKILIVEDEEPLSSILKDRLRNEGFAVTVAVNGEDGLVKALSEKPDLILLDILLPKKGGISMLQELRTHEEGSSIPIIMLTNLSDNSSINEALQLGAHDYMVKADTNMSDLVDNVKTKLNL